VHYLFDVSAMCLVQVNMFNKSSFLQHGPKLNTTVPEINKALSKYFSNKLLIYIHMN
jgi:hypothetical protein